MRLEKRKIVDCFVFNGNIKSLEFRIEKLRPYVDKFVALVPTGTNFIIKDENITQIDFNNDYTTLFEKIKNLNLYVEDIIMLSQINEIPDVPNIDFSECSSTSLLLKQKKCIDSLENYENEEHIGTAVFTLSQLLVNKKLIPHLNLKLLYSLDVTLIYNGWLFSVDREIEYVPHRTINIHLNDYLPKIKTPNKEYYKNNLTEKYGFNKVYFINEIKRQLYSYKPIKEDLFSFHFDNEIKTLKWSDIKSKFLSELLLK